MCKHTTSHLWIANPPHHRLPPCATQAEARLIVTRTLHRGARGYAEPRVESMTRHLGGNACQAECFTTRALTTHHYHDLQNHLNPHAMQIELLRGRGSPVSIMTSVLRKPAKHHQGHHVTRTAEPVENRTPTSTGSMRRHHCRTAIP